MTTIVYDHKNKQIACDSRESANGCIITDEAIKFKERNNQMWFCCGSKCDVDLFIDNFEHNTIAPEYVEVSGFLVDEGAVYATCINGDGVYKKSLQPSSDGIGSGGWSAQAAVDLGKTAKQAVVYAMTRDCFSGGDIHVYDIEKGEFI